MGMSREDQGLIPCPPFFLIAKTQGYRDMLSFEDVEGIFFISSLSKLCSSEDVHRLYNGALLSWENDIQPDINHDYHDIISLSLCSQKA